MKKDGTRGALRISYGDPRTPEEAIAWLWRYLEGARTPGELVGRAIVVLAAEQYASRLVVPSSQQHAPMRWPSHKDHARKALAKLAGPHLPATLKALEKAVANAHAEHDDRGRASNARPGVPAGTEPDDAEHDIETEVDGDADDRETDEDQDDYELDQDADKVVDVAGAIGPDGGVYSDADPGL